MKVAIFEDNLMWGPRLVQSVRALGHEPIAISQWTDDIPETEFALINLGSTVFPPARLMEILRTRPTKVIAHAGHKEKQLHEVGRDLGCDYLATNSEMTFKLPEIFRKVTELGDNPRVSATG